jgi:hypothetical protein
LTDLPQPSARRALRDFRTDLRRTLRFDFTDDFRADLRLDRLTVIVGVTFFEEYPVRLRLEPFTDLRRDLLLRVRCVGIIYYKRKNDFEIFIWRGE